MNHKKHNGFVLMFVITTLVLMGAMIAVLGSMSQRFVFETNTAYLEACSRNVSASGLAWAKYAIENKSPNLSGGRIPLDVNSMRISNATLSIEIKSPIDSNAQVVVHTSVSRGRQHIHKKSVFNLP